MQQQAVVVVLGASGSEAAVVVVDGTGEVAQQTMEQVGLPGCAHESSIGRVCYVWAMFQANWRLGNGSTGVDVGPKVCPAPVGSCDLRCWLK